DDHQSACPLAYRRPRSAGLGIERSRPAFRRRRIVSTTTPRFYITGGTVPPGTPSYVERQADKELLEGLSRGEFCYVLTSRQMGKSSLMVHTALRLRAAGVAVAVLDLTALGQMLTPEQWYDGLLARLGQQLDLEDELEAFIPL